MSLPHLSECLEFMSLNETPEEEDEDDEGPVYVYPGVPLNWEYWKRDYGEELFQEIMALLSRLMTLWHRLCYTCPDTLHQRADGLDTVGPLGYAYVVLGEIELTVHGGEDLVLRKLTLEELECRIEALEDQFLQLLTMKFDPTKAPAIADPYESAVVFSEHLYMNRRLEDLPQDEPGLFLFTTYVACRLGYVVPTSSAPGHEARVLDQLYTCADTSWTKESLQAMWSY